MRSALPAIAAALLACGPVAAQDAITWLQEGVGLSTRVMSAGSWTPAGGWVYATDPLTLWQTGPAATLIAVPAAPARVIGLIDREYGRSTLMALVWSDAPVVCGEDLGTIGVDTGLAGFWHLPMSPRWRPMQTRHSAPTTAPMPNSSTPRPLPCP